MGMTTESFRAPRALATVVFLFLSVSAAVAVKPVAIPADIRVTVTPEAVAPGDDVRVSLELSPKSGIKINRYPKIKLQVPGQDGLVADAEASLGADEMRDDNYFKSIDPLELELSVDKNAPAGKHEIDAKLRYFFCVGKSYCAPKNVAVKIPVTVR